MRWLFAMLLLVGVGALGVFLMGLVHGGLERLGVVHARRYCRQRGLTPRRWRCGTAFDAEGRKTEFTGVELECQNASGGLEQVRLLVWPFGVRNVLEEESALPTAAVPTQLLARKIPYNPSVRSIIFFFGLAIFLAMVVAVLPWPRLPRVVVLLLIVTLPFFLLLRRWAWPREIILGEDSITIPVGFLRLWPVSLPYSDIAFISVGCLGATCVLCIQTSKRTVEIQDLFLPDRETFDLLKHHLGTFVRSPAWHQIA